jgi:hypothetical protein
MIERRTLLDRLYSWWLIHFGERCRHCGKRPEADGDHNCTCPHPDLYCHHTR